MLVLMDDSHVRNEKDKKAESRAQIWKLDEEKRTATLTYNADLGGHAACCGSMQNLKSGGYASLAGAIGGTSARGRATETDKDGKTIFALGLEGFSVYRSFRVDDMYSAPLR